MALLVPSLAAIAIPLYTTSYEKTKEAVGGPRTQSAGGEKTGRIREGGAVFRGRRPRQPYEKGVASCQFSGSGFCVSVAAPCGSPRGLHLPLSQENPLGGDAMTGRIDIIYPFLCVHSPGDVPCCKQGPVDIYARLCLHREGLPPRQHEDTRSLSTQG